MIKVNLGSGFVGLENWLNYDNSAMAKIGKWPFLVRLLVRLHVLPPGYLEVKWPPIINHDCRKGLPLKDHSVDYIYTSHFLEHLFRHESLSLLIECRRVLKTDGILRIVVPDVDRLIELYKAGDEQLFGEGQIATGKNLQKCDAFVSNFYPYELNLSGKPTLKQTLQEPFLRRHKWMYNPQSMEALLHEAGFSRIEHRRFADSALDEVRQIETHEKTSLFIEVRG